jgi:hypothetical protein
VLTRWSHCWSRCWGETQSTSASSSNHHDGTAGDNDQTGNHARRNVHFYEFDNDDLNRLDRILDLNGANSTIHVKFDDADTGHDASARWGRVDECCEL